MTIAENLQRIQNAKTDLREAINNKGGELSEGAKLEEFAEAVENLPSDNPYAVNFGKEIVENNPLYMEYLQEDIDYYNEVVNAVKSGEKTEADYMNTGDFKKRIAWIPAGWSQPTTLNNYAKLQVLDKPDWTFTIKSALSKNSSLQFCRVGLNVADATDMFNGCSSLRFFFSPNCVASVAIRMFDNCYNLDTVELGKISGSMVQAFGSCGRLRIVKIADVSSVTSFSNVFLNCTALTDVYICKWKQGGFPIKNSGNLTVNSIAHLIDNAVSVADGATARTLSLHTTALNRWNGAVKNATIYTREDGTTITCAELASIASNEKGITIA